MEQQNNTSAAGSATINPLEDMAKKAAANPSFLEKALEPFLQMAGFIGGAVAGYYFFAKPKDKEIESLKQTIVELKAENEKQKKKYKALKKLLQNPTLNETLNAKPLTENPKMNLVL